MSRGLPVLSSGGTRAVADGDGDRVLHELAMDYLIKGVIVIVALVVLCLVLVIVYRRVGR
ncbi:hypothetical protein NE235_16105 [Actinoallomurus spadix]|uniref:P6 n=1 Tax=Actinoallomurus spadix TaxID=79912 RepID=A0ABP3HBI1_9ACTN|nr:hypothetical protein [Actinoallomurus spadix]MCO5987625.1 hypothetical protein [Actinoallomurus spadix]